MGSISGLRLVAEGLHGDLLPVFGEIFHLDGLNTQNWAYVVLVLYEGFGLDVDELVAHIPLNVN